MGASNYLRNKALDHVFGGVSYSRPGSLYFQLHTGDPGDDGVSNVATGTGILRVELTNNDTNFPEAASGLKSSGADIVWPVAGGSWGTVTHFSIFDELTGGECIATGSLGAAQSIALNDIFVIPSGDLDLTMT